MHKSKYKKCFRKKIKVSVKKFSPCCLSWYIIFCQRTHFVGDVRPQICMSMRAICSSMKTICSSMGILLHMAHAVDYTHATLNCTSIENLGHMVYLIRLGKYRLYFIECIICSTCHEDYSQYAATCCRRNTCHVPCVSAVWASY